MWTVNRCRQTVFILVLSCWNASQCSQANESAFWGGEFPIRAYKISDSRPAFRPMAMCDDPFGMVYAGGQSGVYRFDGVRWKRVLQRNVRVLLSDDQEDIYLAGGDGVFRFSAKSLYDVQPTELISAEELQSFGGIFEDIARVENDIFVTNVSYSVRFRRGADGKVSRVVYRAEESLPAGWKFRSVREISGRPLFLLESNENYRDSRFAWLEDGEFKLLPLLRFADGSNYLEGIREYVESPSVFRAASQDGAIDLVFRSNNRLYSAVDGRVRDITPELIKSRDAMILRLNTLPGGRIAVLARGVGYVILEADGQVRHLIPATDLPAFWTISFTDRLGRVWIPGENAMHRVDYQADRAFWRVPNGETVYSLEFIGSEFLLVGTHSNAYFSMLSELNVQGHATLVPTGFQTLGLNLGRTKDIEVVDGRPYFATLKGIFTWDPKNPDNPASLVQEGAFHNLLYERKTQRLFAFGIWRQVSLVLKRSVDGNWEEEAKLPDLLRPTEDPILDGDGCIWAIGQRLKPLNRVLHRIDTRSLETTRFPGQWKPVALAGVPYAVNDDGGFATFHAIEQQAVAESAVPEFERLLQEPAPQKWMGSVIDSCVLSDGTLLASTDRESILHFCRKDDDKIEVQSVFGGFVQGIGRTPVQGPSGAIWAGIRDKVYRGELPQYRTSTNKLPRIWISSATIANSRPAAAGAGPQKRPLEIEETDKGLGFSYDYEVGTLRISFGVPAARYPEGVVYRSRMIGLNDAWSAYSGETTREFPALAGGDYRFEVQAILTSGQRLPAAELQVGVNPPWFRTSIFYASCCGLVGLTLLAFLRWKIRLERRQVSALRSEITEREDAERQLVEYQTELVRRERLRALGEMAAGVAHDLNNSLTPVLAFSGLLARNHDLAEERRGELAEMIEKSATDAATIVRRLSPLYRAGSSPRKENDLRELVADVIKSVTERIRTSGKEIEVLHRGEPVNYYCCASDIREVLTNLVNNGIDAIDQAGKITIDCVRNRDAVRLVVSDTGVGMSPAQAEQCLEAFYSDKKEKGSGLGLAVCDSVVRSYGGSISVRSELGKGTAIEVRLPSRLAPAAGENAGDEEGVLPSKRILLVEDYASTRKSIRVLLEVLNQDVVEVGDAEAAARWIESKNFDLLLTDNSLPGESGFDLCQRLKKANQRPALIITSGHEQSGLREACDAFLAKPVSLAKLQSAIREAVENHGKEVEQLQI